MASRYLVTGKQLGIIRGFILLLEKDGPEVIKPEFIQQIREVYEDILDHQYVGNSDQNILIDVNTFSEFIDVVKAIKKQTK